MKVLGLIVEYNPFHNGHLYHLQQSKQVTGADYTVCVMSGNFIQRGEPALVNKWARSRMALLAGVDLVVELPVVYAMASAEYFAYGAVKILDSLGITDYICFGSENGRINELDRIADILSRQPESYRAALKNHLREGLSYPAAREAALKSYLSAETEIGDIGAVLGSSNNILGIEYLKALRRLKSSIRPFTIGRVKNSYNTDYMTGSISSATAIRKFINVESHEKRFYNKLCEVVPRTSLSVLQEEFGSGKGPVFSSDFSSIILSAIRRMTAEQLKALPYIVEGLENRIKEAADVSGTMDELFSRINTKRYTNTRIQRSVFNILTSITGNEFELFDRNGGPQYIRILGFNKNGRRLMSHMNKKASLPIIVKTADFKNSCNPLLKRMLNIEAFSTDMYVLSYKNSAFRKAGQEFTQNIIKVDS